jgi:hypothetical protein
MLKPIFHDIPQAENLWFDLRRGRITASVIKAIMGKNGLLKTADSLAIKIAYESIMTEVDIERFETEDTKRGNDFEEVAIARYEDETGREVTNGGFFTLGDWMGASPDGLIAPKGGTEVKCPRYKGHMQTLKRGAYDPQYYPQMQYQMFVAKLDWIDYISFNLDFPKKHQIFIDTLEADSKYHSLLEERVDQMVDMIKEYQKMIS